MNWISKYEILLKCNIGGAQIVDKYIGKELIGIKHPKNMKNYNCKINDFLISI